MPPARTAHSTTPADQRSASARWILVVTFVDGEFIRISFRCESTADGRRLTVSEGRTERTRRQWRDCCSEAVGCELLAVAAARDAAVDQDVARRMRLSDTGAVVDL